MHKKIFMALCLAIRAGLGVENWYDNFLFSSPSFTFEWIRTAGYAVSGGADIGECVATAKAMSQETLKAWTHAWQERGNFLMEQGKEFAKMGESLSAEGCFFRASNYYRTASFFLDAKENRARAVALWQQSVHAFDRGRVSLPHMRKVKIPYLDTTLPAYFLEHPEGASRPCLIVNTGFDGTKEELYFEVGKEAFARGYQVLLLEGPGQGEVLKEQRIPFRYDWEKVISPVIDYVQTLSTVDREKIALLGISLGGYLAARAACFEKRLCALLLNGGVVDVLENLRRKMGEVLFAKSKSQPDAFTRSMQEEMRKNLETYWFFTNGMWTLGVNSPAEVIQAFEPYQLHDLLERIECPTLVIHSTADAFYPGQSQKVYEGLHCEKTLLTMNPATTGQAHCQMGAIALSNEKIFSWLNGIVLRGVGDKFADERDVDGDR